MACYFTTMAIETDNYASRTHEAVMYEVFIPKKLEYFSIIETVLKTLFDKRLIEKKLRLTPFGKDGDFIAELAAYFTGYSMYEVDGRYVDKSQSMTQKSRNIDERIIVVRLYFPLTEEVIDEERFRSFLSIAMQMLVAQPLIKATDEDEIWMTETTVEKVYVYSKLPKRTRRSRKK